MAIRQVGVRRVARVGFAIGDVAFNIIYQGTAIFLLFVYTDIFGLSPTVAGLIYFGALACDALTDPLAGVLADRTRTRWGRFRPWLIFGGPFLAASYPLAFWRPEFAAGWLVGWTLLTHCTLRFLYAFVSIPFSSLHSRLSRNAEERSIISGYRMIGAGVGGIIIASLTPWIVARNQVASDGYALAGVVGGVLILAFLWFATWVLREPAEDSDERPKHEPIWRDVIGVIALMKHNPPLKRVFIAFIAATIATGVQNGMQLYYFKYVLQDESALRIALSLGPFVFMGSVPFWVWLGNRTSKRKAWLIATVGAIVALSLLFLIGRTSSTVSVGLLSLTGFFATSFAVMQWSMLPDTIEYGEAMTGKRHEARAYGFASFAQKVSMGFSAFLIGVLLDIAGYVANTPQTQSTQTAIAAMIALIPLAGVIVAAAAVWRYPIDSAYHADLLRRIAERGAPSTA